MSVLIQVRAYFQGSQGEKVYLYLIPLLLFLNLYGRQSGGGFVGAPNGVVGHVPRNI